MAGLLKVTTFAAFTLDSDKKTPRIRWDSGVSASNVIIGAQVKVPEWNRLSRSPTDRNGHATIDIRGIKSFFVLRLEPPSISLCDQPAGPLLASPAPDEKRQFGIMTERRLRPLEIEVFVMDGHVRSDLPPRVVKGMTHGRVIKHTGDSLEIDWKPDWITARRADPRNSEEVIDDRMKGKSERPIGLFTSGQGIIVLHRPDVADMGSVLNKFLNGKENAHYVIDVDGHVVKMIDDKDNMSSHAGKGAQWEGKSPVNAFSIGIELVNEKGPFPRAQMSSLITLLDKLRKTYRIPRDRVLAHCEVRPFDPDGDSWVNPRQECPGYEFDWPILEKNGHATQPSFRENATLPSGFDEFFLNSLDDMLLYPNSDIGEGKYGKKNRSLPSGRHDLVSQIQRNLYEIGYERPPEPWKPGKFDVRTELLVKRFQGRYMTGARKKYLGDDGTENLGKVTLHTLVLMLAVLAAKGREWRPFW
ncbi:MAG: N-acetylmuramoyl-L-alanine amidase [Polyangiaceae bacterium]|nr:N-acetylmuramoyl-L-alanine amidase [Polyangiaceae bacterium]